MKTLKTAKPLPDQDTAFTRTDFLAALAGILLLGSIVLPILAAVNPVAEREQCRNNLRLIGQAFQGWGKDHGNRPPWRFTVKDGGTYDLPGNGNAWIHLAWLSNYIESPKILACPSDSVRVASDWSRNRQSGFLHPNYRGNAVSYFVGLDAQEKAPKSLLGGDSYLEVSASRQRCDYANVDGAFSLKPGDKTVGWLDKLHGDPGNILFQDGHVAELTSERLRQALPKTEAVHEDNHILRPR
jgi:prepilin-type processing-associated H-X9-DG protein